MVDYREQYQSENGEWIMIDPRNPDFILKRRGKMWKTLRFTPEYLRYSGATVQSDFLSLRLHLAHVHIARH